MVVDVMDIDEISRETGEREMKKRSLGMTNFSHPKSEIVAYMGE